MVGRFHMRSRSIIALGVDCVVLLGREGRGGFVLMDADRGWTYELDTVGMVDDEVIVVAAVADFDIDDAAPLGLSLEIF